MVRGNEGTIPHFHLTSNTKTTIRGKNRNFETCICIFESKYFNHNTYQDKLTRVQCIRLNEWMMRKNDNNRTNWDEIVDSWSFINGDKYVPENAKQPDYRYLEYMRK